MPLSLSRIFFSPLLKAVQDDLRIRLRGKGVPQLQQFLSDLLIIIDFAVEIDYQSFVLVKNWLMSRAQVYNTQAAEAHGYKVILVKAAVVRPSVGNDLRHILNCLIPVNDLSCKTADPTHSKSLLINPFKYL